MQIFVSLSAELFRFLGSALVEVPDARPSLASVREPSFGCLLELAHLLRSSRNAGDFVVVRAAIRRAQCIYLIVKWHYHQ
mmetsp:Transcript_6143/g.15720  ORF Transcript_6143/g.15720 Transcript_6143/m.15720 type:complete len:80 (+) Transcript_6143:183-422(+)